ncbi:hypothetical protein [Halomicrobium salinisoli]|uniref:hypothetical protein n=1 Tax=Halomicrobium salinisoli TaxID=2878391 RepID=UPI001CF07584|nr:hypothetical protein [Halomicrobium salinisoli]
MNRTLLAVGVVALVALAGCAGLSGNERTGTNGSVETGIEMTDNTTGATNVTHWVGAEVGEETAGEELSAIGATYPREHFTVDSAKHEQIRLGVDTNGDGEPDRTFNESHVSGVNNNAYSFDVTLDTDYTLQSGDIVTVAYPAVDHPDEAGEYTVSVRLNDRQTSNQTVVVGDGSS